MRRIEIIEDAMSVALKQYGYRKRKTNWYAQRQETILVINLQKSQWGQQFYINFGIWLRILGAAEHPPFWRCHVSGRPPYQDRTEMERALDLETKLPSEQRRATVMREVTCMIIPFMEERQTLEQIKQLHKEDRLHASIILPQLHAQLGIVSRKRGLEDGKRRIVVQPARFMRRQES